MGSKLTREQYESVSGQHHRNFLPNKESSGSEPRSNILTSEQGINYGKLSLAAETESNFPRSPSSNLATEKKSDLIIKESNSQQQETEQEKCYDIQDASLTFVDGDDDLDFLCEGYKSLKARMSCGHAVTPMSLTNWCRYLLDQGESRFVCGQTKCNAEWSYEEVCKMALLTPEEMEYFEKKIFSSAVKDYLDVKACPGCMSSVVRTDLSNLRVLCTVCTADRHMIFEFCWQCLNEWKCPSKYSDRCANAGCINKPLEILKTCPDITFKDVKGVTGCPSTRACPTCGLLVVHDRTGCKNISCPRCKVKFCFVCLRLSAECGSFYGTCSIGIAPRQTSIPVWKK